MGTITRTDEDVELLSDPERLKQIGDAITAIQTTGQSYTIFGSRVVTRGNLKELYDMQSRLEQRILLKKGWTGRNYADNSAVESQSGDPPRS